MKMRWWMVVVIHGNSDPKKAANFWHYSTSSIAFSASLTRISPDMSLGKYGTPQCQDRKRANLRSNLAEQSRDADVLFVTAPPLGISKGNEQVN